MLANLNSFSCIYIKRIYSVEFAGLLLGKRHKLKDGEHIITVCATTDVHGAYFDAAYTEGEHNESSLSRVSTYIRKLRKEGHKVGLIRPLTLHPFPEKVIANIDEKRVKNILVMENSTPAQFYYDVKAALNGKQIPLHLYTRSMGIMISGEEAEEQLRKLV